MAKVFKVYVDTGESVWSTNALEFSTYDEAKKWGDGLFMRWMAVREFAVVSVDAGSCGWLKSEEVRACEAKS